MSNFSERVTLGSSGLKVRQMGIGSDAGVSARALEMAFEKGVNYFYWGTRRREGMKEAVRNLCPRHRDDVIVALQSYDVTGLLMKKTFVKGLKQLGIEYADVFILGMRNKKIPNRILDRALSLKERGLVRYLCVSAHDRSAYEYHLGQNVFDLVMVRYNAAHRGAEKDVFPLLPDAGGPGVICYNSTRWGHLFDPGWMPEGARTPAPVDLYRYVLSNPNIQMVLTAPETFAQLEENLTTLESDPVSEEERKWLEAIGDHVHAGSPNTNFDFLFPTDKRAKK